MPQLTFEIAGRASDCQARLGRLTTLHGVVETPVFMPVGTQGTVKAMSQQELAALGFRILLGNTYHLHLRPGEDLVRRAGGLHGFIGWERAILTDSGGFQVFSLEELRRVTEEGVLFRSHIDGSQRFFSPAGVVDIQLALGSDVMMVLDECVANPCPYEQARAAMERTHRWAAACRDRWREREGDDPAHALFGIVQGSRYLDLRAESAAAIGGIDFTGAAIGGVSVGEPQEEMYAVVRHTAPLLPPEKPRYLMGVGTPLDLLEAVRWGVDMFDCVLPTRLGRNGTAYTARGRVNIKGSRYAEELGPVDPGCRGWCCRNYSAAYVRHLYRANEILAARLLTYHNLHFYAELMDGIRTAIRADRYEAFRAEFLSRYQGAGGPDTGDGEGG